MSYCKTNDKCFLFTQIGDVATTKAPCKVYNRLAAMYLSPDPNSILYVSIMGFLKTNTQLSFYFFS